MKSTIVEVADMTLIVISSTSKSHHCVTFFDSGSLFISAAGPMDGLPILFYSFSTILSQNVKGWWEFFIASCPGIPDHGAFLELKQFSFDNGKGPLGCVTSLVSPQILRLNRPPN